MAGGEPNGPATLGFGSRWPAPMSILDAAVACFVFLYNLAIVARYWPEPLRYVAVVAISAVLCGAWLVRRSYPLGSFAAMSVGAWLQVLVGVDALAADVLMMLGVYNVASRRPWRVSVLAPLAAGVWVLIVVGPRLSENYLRPQNLVQILLMLVVAWLWGTVVRARREKLAALEARAEQLEREKEAQAQIAAARERTRIAREMHDIVSHGLSAVVLLADGAAAKVRTDPHRSEEAMRTVGDTGRSALAEMRRMLAVLRDDEASTDAPQPGTGQLAQLVDDARAAGLPATLAVSGASRRLPDGLDLTVYRLVQEALTNARRHGGPDLTSVEVALWYGPDRVEVRVTDDGDGVEAAPGEADVRTGYAGGGKHGLVGMRERVAAYGGSLRTGPRADRRRGFEVTAALPVTAAGGVDR